MESIRLHTGEIVTGERLREALKDVANDWRQLAHDIRKEDAYASHITETEKDRFLYEGLSRADQIETGEVNGFWIWQRVNEKLTGDCVALLA